MSSGGETPQQVRNRLISKLKDLKVKAWEIGDFDRANEYRKQIEQLSSNVDSFALTKGQIFLFQTVLTVQFYPASILFLFLFHPQPKSNAS